METCILILNNNEGLITGKDCTDCIKGILQRNDLEGGGDTRTSTTVNFNPLLFVWTCNKQLRWVNLLNY